MYSKYFGIDHQTGKARTSFLEDGYFRFTQPKSLNDPKEARPKIYIEKYSPKDIQLARIKMQDPSSRFLCGNNISDEEVIKLGLNLFPPLRYGDVSPFLVHKAGFKNMKEHDEARLTAVYSRFQEQLNKEVGIFSLTKNKTNPVMWSSYANDYNGTVLEFDEQVASIPECNCREVIYDPDKIDCQISLNKGVVRFNGFKVDKSSPSTIRITDELIDSFLYHKETVWTCEEEFRLITRLATVDKAINDVYLKSIPFCLFRALYIGYKMPSEDLESMKDLIRRNSQLSHIRIYRQTFSQLSGDIEFIESGL